MSSLKLFWIITKRTGANKFLYGFIVYFFISCLLIGVFDKNISNIWDALWFGFNVVTSIGLGDYTVTNPVARIITILLGLYGALILSFIPGLISSYYMEKVKIAQNDSIETFLDQLEHLDTLDKTTLKNISQKVTELHKQTLAGKRTNVK